MEDDILTIEEVAKYLRVSDRTVYDWAQKGEIPAGKIGTVWRFKKSELEKWVNERLSSSSVKKSESEVQIKNFLSPDRVVFIKNSSKRDAIVDKLVGKGVDESKKYLYGQFADSLEGYVAETEKSGISNGDKVSVIVTYDKELAKAAGISVGSSSFNVRAKGIEAGKKINLFDNVDVIFAGISPDAYVVTRNTWEDEFLSQLSYTADIQKNIKVNDEVTIHCNVDDVELGRHGYITDSFDKIYIVDKLSTYVEDASQIDNTVLLQRVQLCTASIKKETEDTSFRMLYKATNDKKYLHEPNEETADNITMIDSKFLERSNTASKELAKNKIVLIFSADITCSDYTETIYFGYVYENAYLTTDGSFNVLTNGESDKYYCNVNFDDMMSEILGGSEDNYSVYGFSVK